MTTAVPSITSVAVVATDTNTTNDDASIQVVLENKDGGDSDSNSDDE